MNEYRQLACAVVNQAIKDFREYYIKGRSFASCFKCLETIDEMWFDIIGMDKEWFIERFLKQEEIRHERKRIAKCRIGFVEQQRIDEIRKFINQRNSTKG